MTHFLKDILKHLLLILTLLIIFCGIKQSPRVEASVSLEAGIAYEPATGNLDAASLPSGISSFYSHESPYFILAGGADVYFKKVTLYIYNSSGSQVFSETRTLTNDYFRFTNISVQLSAGSYKYEWEYLVTTGSSSNSYQTIQSGKISFSVTDLTYTVSYNANGGSGAPSSQTKYYGKTLKLSSTTPTRTGYTFLGWATSNTATAANSSYAPGSTYSTNANLNLYAVWETKKYTVAYNANGGSGGPSLQTKNYGEPLTLSLTTPTRIGYTFLGWSTSSTATVADSSYAPGKTYSTNANLNLYAVWEAKKYSVTYNANGGSGAPSSQTKYYEKTLTLRTTKPTRIGYNFLGWSTNSSATTATYQPGDAYTHNMGATLYAVWRPNEYDVCYDANGGSGAPLLQTKYYGQPLTLSRIEPTRTGYTFLGWSTKNTSTIVSYSAGGTYTVNEPIILYAVWKKNESNSGTQSSNTTTVTKPATTQKTSSSTPVKKKYVFKVGQIVKVGFLKYKIIKLSGNSGTVTVIGATNKKAKKLVIPKNIKKNGITFKITEIAKNAFKNYKKLSFLRIKASSIIKIGKNALKGTKRKIKIMVPTSKLKQYSKMIKKAR